MLLVNLRVGDLSDLRVVDWNILIFVSSSRTAVGPSVLVHQVCSLPPYSLNPLITLRLYHGQPSHQCQYFQAATP
jgi:hypothetical protein